MSTTLAFNAATAILEGVGYAIAAVLLWRMSRDPWRRMFAAWWATNAVGMASSAILLGTGAAGAVAVGIAKASLAVTFAAASAGVALVCAFFGYILGGNRIGLAVAPLAAVAAISSIAALMAAEVVGIIVGPWGVQLSYATEAPPALFVAQGLLALLAIGITVAVLVASRGMERSTRRRVVMVGVAVLLYYVSKAMMGFLLTGPGAGVSMVVLRLAGLTAAALGVRAYARPMAS